jgi:hypothetical protein
VDETIGCERFESSGLPAHPTVLQKLIQRNPRCQEIPIDPAATESSWSFSDKINQYLPETNISRQGMRRVQ